MYTCFSVLFVHYCRTETPLPTAYIPPACFSINLRHNTTPPSVFTTGLNTSHLRPTVECSEMKLRCNQAILSRLVSLAIFIGRSSILLGNLSLPSPLLYSACFLLTALALEMCLEKWFRFETATADSYSHIKVGTDH